MDMEVQKADNSFAGGDDGEANSFYDDTFQHPVHEYLVAPADYGCQYGVQERKGEHGEDEYQMPQHPFLAQQEQQQQQQQVSATSQQQQPQQSYRPDQLMISPSAAAYGEPEHMEPTTYGNRYQVQGQNWRAIDQQSSERLFDKIQQSASSEPTSAPDCNNNNNHYQNLNFITSHHHCQSSSTPVAVVVTSSYGGNESNTYENSANLYSSSSDYNHHHQNHHQQQQHHHQHQQNYEQLPQYQLYQAEGEQQLLLSDYSKQETANGQQNYEAQQQQQPHPIEANDGFAGLEQVTSFTSCDNYATSLVPTVVVAATTTTAVEHSTSGSDQANSKGPRGQSKGRRGRPRKKGIRSKSKVNGKLWEFIRDLLLSERTNPSFIRWERREDGVFKFVQSDKVAKMWGERKQNPKMTYEKLSRAMRYYYKSKVLLPVFGRRLVYKFGPNATGWMAPNETEH